MLVLEYRCGWSCRTVLERGCENWVWKWCVYVMDIYVLASACRSHLAGLNWCEVLSTGLENIWWWNWNDCCRMVYMLKHIVLVGKYMQYIPTTP